MKIMAEGDYFNIGMIIACTTCHGDKIEGEVVAFDHETKILALKSAAASGKAHHHDLRLINLSLITNVEVLQEVTEPPAPLGSLNLAKIHSRVRQNLEEKNRQVNYIGVGVTPLAQKLFHAITKTITDVSWDGDKIVVMDQVTIVPPYDVENCQCIGDSSKALQHVCKIVQKFYQDCEREGGDRPSPAATPTSQHSSHS